MEKFIPYEKLSKKKKRELDARRRNVWQINPVTRKPAVSKAYNRKKARKQTYDANPVPFVFPRAGPTEGISPSSLDKSRK